MQCVPSATKILISFVVKIIIIKFQIMPEGKTETKINLDQILFQGQTKFESNCDFWPCTNLKFKTNLFSFLSSGKI